MLPIHKNQENPLLEFAKIPGVTYDDNRLPKRELKESLLKEQGYLCAYCMSRIGENSMKVEHWAPQNPDTDEGELSSEEKEKRRLLSIDYKNMLAVCKGDERSRPQEQHCDTKKGNETILYNPSNPNDYNKLKIRYLHSGRIESSDEEFNKEIENKLNLNCQKLISNRANIIQKIFQSLNMLKNNASSRRIDSILKNWNSQDSNGKLKEYAGVAIYFLTKRRNIKF